MVQLAQFLSRTLRAMTVEPVMLMDGACKEAMLLYTENVHMEKICTLKMGYSQEVCQNLSDYEEEDVAVQRELTMFTLYNSIIMSVLPLVYVLFMGAWSDKYGRKIPILISLVCRLLHAAGYLLVNWQTSWPVEALLPMTFLEGLGGGNAGILSSTISYISDVSSEKNRTSRLSTANSLWFLGGPMGTLLAAVLIRNYGYNLPLGLVLVTYIAAVAYVVMFISESHGPYAKKELRARGSLQPQENIAEEKVPLSTMVKDFFDWHRVVESFKTAFKKRDGNARAVLLLILVGNMLRRVARSFFMYQFVRQVLEWDASEYGYWITYRNLLAALGSLFLVPLLTSRLSFSDTALVVVGAGSIILEYLFYGLTGGMHKAVLMWIGPPVGLVSNACVIAFKSMATKLVTSGEKGRVNAVIAALNGLMPMIGYFAYSPIYYHTIDTFPAAQFYFGAAVNLLIMILFMFMGTPQNPEEYDTEKGGDEPTPSFIFDLKRRSSVILKVMAHPLDLPGCKNVNDIPSPPRLQSQPSQEELTATPTHESLAGCHSNELSDADLTMTEAAGEEGASGDTAAPHASPPSPQAEGEG